MSGTRVIVVGLDCAAPTLLFDRYRASMPHLSQMMAEGTWGELRSSDPPITVPAWTCMVTGRDPGELGLYGFRNRVRGRTELSLGGGPVGRTKHLWDWLGERGVRVAPLFVPLAAPPWPVFGEWVAGFLSTGDPWCYPPSIGDELESRFGTYRSDVEDFRADDHERILADIQTMTEQHFDIAKHVWETRQPGFMMMVEIGLDRFHHAFWRHLDPSHPRHDPNNPWIDAGREYHAQLDQRLGDLKRCAGRDTTILVVSDHGARAMHGGFCINDWLIDRGDLVLHEKPTEPTPFRHDLVDWSRTTAWAEGGYYARVCLNVEGREPRGALRASEVAGAKASLRRSLTKLTDDRGRPVPTTVHDPLDHYRKARGFPPDLMVYFADLSLRAVASVGNGRRIVEGNDTGPDSCNHDWNGVFVMSGGAAPPRGRVSGAEIYDLTPTVLGLYDIERPPEILGRDWSR